MFPFSSQPVILQSPCWRGRGQGVSNLNSSSRWGWRHLNLGEGWCWNLRSGATALRLLQPPESRISETGRGSAPPGPTSGVCTGKGAAVGPGHPSPARALCPPARSPAVPASLRARSSTAAREATRSGDQAGCSSGDRGGGGQGACALQGRQIWREGECPKLFV